MLRSRRFQELAVVLLAAFVANPLHGCGPGSEPPEPRRQGTPSADVIGPDSLQEVFHTIDRYVERSMESWRIPGLALGIVRGGELVYARGFGYRDPDLTLPVTSQTDFSLASMTKAFTALTCGLLVEDSILGWNTPIAQVDSGFRLSDPDLTASVTLADILSHRTGLGDKDDLWTSGEYRAEEIFQHLDELQVVGPLRDHYEYSNVLYIGAGVLVERLTGRPWDQVARERILTPLGMTGSGFSVQELLNEADFSYSFSEADGAFVANDFPGPEHSAWFFPRASGSMYSNVADLAKWMVFHMQDGLVEGVSVVREDIVQESHTVANPLSDPPFYLSYPGIDDHGYARGWFVDQYRNHRRLHHGGVSMGYSNYITLFPDDALGIVVLSNREVLFPVELMYYVGDLMLGLRPEDWAGRFAEYRPGG